MNKPKLTEFSISTQAHEMILCMGVARPNILLKQAFLRYVIEHVDLQARSF